MNRLGFGLEDLLSLRRNIIYVSLNCYGHTGPWVNRPGWEHLAQSVSGLATEMGTLEILNLSLQRYVIT